MRRARLNTGCYIKLSMVSSNLVMNGTKNSEEYLIAQNADSPNASAMKEPTMDIMDYSEAT
jgi:hypothetical protein